MGLTGELPYCEVNKLWCNEDGHGFLAGHSVLETLDLRRVSAYKQRVAHDGIFIGYVGIVVFCAGSVALLACVFDPYCSGEL